MKTLAVLVLFVAASAPALLAQGANPFTGKWEGTMTMQRPDGTDADPQNAAFNLTQKGKVLTGTAGPPDRQWNIEKGAVNDGKATFEVQQPNGTVLKFDLAIVKGHLQGEMSGERDGQVRKAKIDAVKGK